MNKIPEIKPIDIKAHMDSEKETLKLFDELYRLILQELEKATTLSFEYFNMRIEAYRLKLCIDQQKLLPSIPRNDPDMIQILTEKRDWLEKQSSDNYIEKIEIEKNKFFTKLYIKAGFFGADTPKHSPEYEALLRFELDQLMKASGFDEMTKIERKIRIFYIKEELIARNTAGAVKITKIESDRLIDNKIFAYNEILGDLILIRNLLNKQILSIPGTSIEKLKKRIELFKLKTEIASKQDYSNRFRERKNILP
jgi:hypothetical protein